MGIWSEWSDFQGCQEKNACRDSLSNLESRFRVCQTEGCVSEFLFAGEIIKFCDEFIDGKCYEYQPCQQALCPPPTLLTKKTKVSFQIDSLSLDQVTKDDKNSILADLQSRILSSTGKNVRIENFKIQET